MRKHLLLIGGRDHTIRKLNDLGIDHTLLQTKALVTDKQLTSSKRVLVGDYEYLDEILVGAIPPPTASIEEAIRPLIVPKNNSHSLYVRELC